MMTDAKLQGRDAKHGLGVELRLAVQEFKAKKAARTTTFEPMADGSVCRTVTLASGVLHSQEVLAGPQWQLLAARMQAGM